MTFQLTRKNKDLSSNDSRMEFSPLTNGVVRSPVLYAHSTANGRLSILKIGTAFGVMRGKVVDSEIRRIVTRRK